MSTTDIGFRLAEKAKTMGLEAACVNIAGIVINPDFRKYCAENRCGQYDANYSCPPACGAVEEMSAVLMGFARGLVVRSTWDIESYSDRETIFKAKKQHNEAMLTLCDGLRQEAISCKMCGASHCLLCDACAKLRGEPCREPERRYSCLSAYCIDVAKLAESAGMDFSWSEKKLSLYGLIAF